MILLITCYDFHAIEVEHEIYLDRERLISSGSIVDVSHSVEYNFRENIDSQYIKKMLCHPACFFNNVG